MKTEELLGNDPELVRLYYLQGRRPDMERQLRQHLLELASTDNPLFKLAIEVSRHKDVGERSKDLGDLEELVNDVVEGYDLAIEELQVLVAEVRQQASELPSLGPDVAMQRVSDASFQAFYEAEQRYGKQLAELYRRFVAMSKSAGTDSAL